MPVFCSPASTYTHLIEELGLQVTQNFATAVFHPYSPQYRGEPLRRLTAASLDSLDADWQALSDVLAERVGLLGGTPSACIGYPGTSDLQLGPTVPVGMK